MSFTLLAAMSPFFKVGSSDLLSWLATFAIIAVAVVLVVWLVTKFAGPPSIPEPFRWIIWLIVAIVLLVFLFAALGVKLP